MTQDRRKSFIQGGKKVWDEQRRSARESKAKLKLRGNFLLEDLYPHDDEAKQRQRSRRYVL